VDPLEAVTADHQGLAAACAHELFPVRLWPTGDGQVRQAADVVHGDAVRGPAELASARLEPTDQLLVRVDGPGRDGVGQDRRLLPLQGDGAEPCEQWLPALSTTTA
jgi:hypothetical protein